MKRTRWKLSTLLLLLPVGLMGCNEVYSIHPFYTKEDVIANDQLVGAWITELDQMPQLLYFKYWSYDSWDISKGSEKTYQVKLTRVDDVCGLKKGLVNSQPFAEEPLEAVVFDLGGRKFIDITSSGDQGSMASVPVHRVFRLDVDANGLRLSGLSMAWHKNNLDSLNTKVLYTLREDDLFLSGKTAALRKMLLETMNLSEAWKSDQIELQKGGPPPETYCFEGSAQPYFRPSDRLFESDLLGDWEMIATIQDEEENFFFHIISRPGEPPGYLLLDDKESEPFYSADLFQLAGQQFIVLDPTESALEDDVDHQPWILRLDRTQAGYRLIPLDLEWLVDQLKTKNLNLAHQFQHRTSPSSNLLLTATTSQIRRFLKRYGGQERAWRTNEAAVILVRPAKESPPE